MKTIFQWGKLLCSFLIFLAFSSQAYAADVASVASGNWSDASIWSSGTVPTATDNVTITTGHLVHYDSLTNRNNIKINFCHDLTVEDGAKLTMGHNVVRSSGKEAKRRLIMTGNLTVDGIISAGRDTNGIEYLYNARINIQAINPVTTVSGNGTIHLDELKFEVITGAGKQINVEHHYIWLNHKFFAKSADKVSILVSKAAYVRVDGTFGLNGPSEPWTKAGTAADFTVEGTIVADNLNLFTKNSDPNEASSLTIQNHGYVTTQMLNEDNPGITCGTATSTLNIINNGSLRIGKDCTHPDVLANADPNMILNEDQASGGRIMDYYTVTAETDANIKATVESNRPAKGNLPDESFKSVYGATLTGAGYSLTSDPIMYEGIARYKEMGSRTIKTKISAQTNKMKDSYAFNSNWKSWYKDLVAVAQTEYVDNLFLDPYFTEHVFWVSPKKKTREGKTFYRHGPDFYGEDYKDEEEQFYQLAKHILETYSHLDKTFIFQNWEGDWMLRGEQGKDWEGGDPVPDDVEVQVAGMIKMFQARQRGVERAREEVTGSLAKVAHAIEFNKLFTVVDGERKTMMDLDIPSLVGEVLSHVRVDMVSWSAYDGVWMENLEDFPIGLWKGTEIMEYYHNVTGYLDQTIQIGEIGINENNIAAKIGDHFTIEDMYDRMAGCALALDWNNYFIWSLYAVAGDANGTTLNQGQVYPTDTLLKYLDGKWVYRPDDKWGTSGHYFVNMLAPQTIRSTSSGDWSNPATWEGNQVPTLDDNVVIGAGHSVHVDVTNANSNATLKIAQNLTVETGATMTVGHEASFTKILAVTGNLIVNGSIEKGAYTKNARLYVNGIFRNNYISGSGSMDVLTVQLNNQRFGLIKTAVDMPTINTEEHFMAKTPHRIEATFSANTTINAGGQFGLTGSGYGFMSNTALADFIVYGNVNAYNVNLLTKNPQVGKGSSLTLKSGSSINVNRVNQNNAALMNADGTFTLTIESGAQLNITSNVLDLDQLDLADPNFIYLNQNSTARRSNPHVSASKETEGVFVYRPYHESKLYLRHSLDKTSDYQIIIFNLAGKKVFEQSIDPALKTIDFSNWPSGVYIAKWNDPLGVRTLKFTK